MSHNSKYTFSAMRGLFFHFANNHQFICYFWTKSLIGIGTCVLLFIKNWMKNSETSRKSNAIEAETYDLYFSSLIE